MNKAKKKAINYLMRTVGKKVMLKYYEKAIDIAIEETEIYHNKLLTDTKRRIAKKSEK